MRPVARTVRWPVEAAFAAMAVAVMVHGHVVDAPEWQYDVRLRLAAALAAAGAGMVLDDVADRTLESAPRYRRLALAGRVAGIVVLASTAWLACVVLVPGPIGDLAVGALAVEGTAWLLAGLAVARLFGSSAVTASLLVGVVVVYQLPQRWTLVSAPGAPEWDGVRLRWAGIAVAAACCLWWALRDPARKGKLQ
jgi:hypothetical protein